MLVAVVDIRIVRVCVFETVMPVGMRMRLARRVICLMLMLMMFVVNVPVIVPHEFMDVRVFMTFGNVQP